ncbi:hypothetical protein SAMN05660831_00257 [Thiohalospira halophila DSM 15071]|uniref:Asparagine synthase (Glutamine-hydrolysing) n=1 Tax=Thiohalospira halophila DSM 15071 TaxID=1123397 RepID=A0A1I1NFT9_9GAMM|nr:hypothetical protein [Thiohalospira halophila]SFC96397.1 hypothetical protein SAMN05660831_00257 [Thiohalospira halophila DSM 15071]
MHKTVYSGSKLKGEQRVELSVHGMLMGWTDGDTSIKSRRIQSTVEKEWERGGADALATFMRGVVGPCMIEVSTADAVWLFASCASSGFYWMPVVGEGEEQHEYLVSNQEGRFLRAALRMGGELSEGAVMNAVLSHQSVIRPPFSGLVKGTHRCPPGFYVEFSSGEARPQTFLINKEPKTRRRQDADLGKKCRAVAEIYESYCKDIGANATISFSGGVDSTALLLLHKSGLDRKTQGYYIDRGKVSEKKMASDIARRAGCEIDFIKPLEGFSSADVRKRAGTGLAVLNGVGYMKHSFRYCPIEGDNEIQRLVLTGQNSDMMFHIDHYAPSSFTTGLVRNVKMAAGIPRRFRKTVAYYAFLYLSNESNLSSGLPPGVEESFIGLSEHGAEGGGLEHRVKHVVMDYKHEHYVVPTSRWFQSAVYPELSNSRLHSGLKVNHAARLARWLRTIGSIHQQFLNNGTHENLVICTPFSEGPLAVELLSYRLGLRDVLMPKRFLHGVIRSQLGVSYSRIRHQVLGGGWIDLPSQVARYSARSIKRLAKRFLKIQHNEQAKSSTTRHAIGIDDLRNLREILGHQDGVVERTLLNYVNDDECRTYLNRLYDCLELRVDPDSLSKTDGMQLCRLVNLQVMLEAEETFSV